MCRAIEELRMTNPETPKTTESIMTGLISSRSPFAKDITSGLIQRLLPEGAAE